MTTPTELLRQALTALDCLGNSSNYDVTPEAWKKAKGTAVCNAITEFLAAPAPAVPQWQPIETAPKNKCFMAVVDGCVRLVSWGKTSHVPMWGWCLADQGAEDFDLCRPTHWMPLPQPPKEKA